MKLVTSILFLFISFTALSAQTTREVLEEKLVHYTQLTKEKDNAGMIEYIHPKIFELAPKNEIIAAMDKLYTDPKQEISFDDLSISRISNILEHNKIAYAVVNYTFKMQFHLTEAFFKQEEEKGEPTDRVDLMDFMLKSFVSRFGNERVSLDKATNTFYIDVESEMFAINDPAIGDWKFIENKAQYAEILNQIVPAKVRKKLKS